jgi:hypothetical protein
MYKRRVMVQGRSIPRRVPILAFVIAKILQIDEDVRFAGPGGRGVTCRVDIAFAVQY